MTYILAGLALVGFIQAQEKPRNIWASQYNARAAEDMAAQFENERRPVYRHRDDIVSFVAPEAGWTVAEIGAGSGFLSRIIAAMVGRSGRAIATELDPKMVDYMNARAAREGLPNFTAVKGSERDAGLEPASADALVVVNTYSFFDRPGDMLRSMARALKPRGILAIVDFPKTAGGGVDAEDVKKAAAAAGFDLLEARSIVPGQFALRFRRR